MQFLRTKNRGHSLGFKEV